MLLRQVTADARDEASSIEVLKSCNWNVSWWLQFPWIRCEVISCNSLIDVFFHIAHMAVLDVYVFFVGGDGTGREYPLIHTPSLELHCVWKALWVWKLTWVGWSKSAANVKLLLFKPCISRYCSLFYFVEVVCHDWSKVQRGKTKQTLGI